MIINRKKTPVLYLFLFFLLNKYYKTIFFYYGSKSLKQNELNLCKPRSGFFYKIQWEGAMRTLDKGRAQCSSYAGEIIFRLDMILQSETENVNIREYHINSFS